MTPPIVKPILGIDTGFASMGWAVVDVARSPLVLAAGCIRTTKDERKVLATEDNIKRSREIWRGLDAVWWAHSPIAIGVESMSWPRSSSVVAKMGLAWGIVIAFAERHELPIVTVSPQDLKLRIAGSKTASKKDMKQAVLSTEAGQPLTKFLSSIPSGEHEHPIDAVGAVLSVLETDVIRALRRTR